MGFKIQDSCAELCRSGVEAISSKKGGSRNPGILRGLRAETKRAWRGRGERILGFTGFEIREKTDVDFAVSAH